MNEKEIYKKKDELLAKMYLYENELDTQKSLKKVKKLNLEYDELTTRLLINTFIVEGLGLKAFMQADFDCTKKISKMRLKRLWKEQFYFLGKGTY